MLSFVSSFQILDIHPLSDVSMNMFSHSNGLSFYFVDDSYSDRYEVISHCGFNLHFSDN